MLYHIFKISLGRLKFGIFLNNVILHLCSSIIFIGFKDTRHNQVFFELLKHVSLMHMSPNKSSNSERGTFSIREKNKPGLITIHYIDHFHKW